MIPLKRLLDFAVICWVLCGLCVGAASWIQFGDVGSLVAAAFWFFASALGFLFASAGR